MKQTTKLACRKPPPDGGGTSAPAKRLAPVDDGAVAGPSGVTFPRNPQAAQRQKPTAGVISRRKRRARAREAKERHQQMVQFWMKLIKYFLDKSRERARSAASPVFPASLPPPPPTPPPATVERVPKEKPSVEPAEAVAGPSNQVDKSAAAPAAAPQVPEVLMSPAVLQPVTGPLQVPEVPLSAAMLPPATGSLQVPEVPISAAVLPPATAPEATVATGTRGAVIEAAPPSTVLDEEANIEEPVEDQPDPPMVFPDYFDLIPLMEEDLPVIESFEDMDNMEWAPTYAM